MTIFSSSGPRSAPKQSRRSTTARVLSVTKIRELIGAIDEMEHDGGAGTLVLGGEERLDVSNLDKRFFPKRGYTKGDLLAYYASVSPALLPAMRDRPLVMKRFPNGITAPSFYQQRAPDDPPRGVRVEPVADEWLKTQLRLVGGDLTTLLYLVQLGAVSVDPWHSRVQSV